MNQNDTVSPKLAQLEKGLNTTTNNGTSRRKFLGQVGAALAGGAVLKTAIASGQNYNPAIGDGIASPAKPIKDPRVKQSLAIRNTAATLESQIPVPPHTTNGDEQLYPHKSGTYSKGILQDGIGLVNLAAFHWQRNLSGQSDKPSGRPAGARPRQRSLWNGVGRDVLGFAATGCRVH